MSNKWWLRFLVVILTFNSVTLAMHKVTGSITSTAPWWAHVAQALLSLAFGIILWMALDKTQDDQR